MSPTPPDPATHSWCPGACALRTTNPTPGPLDQLDPVTRWIVLSYALIVECVDGMGTYSHDDDPLSSSGYRWGP